MNRRSLSLLVTTAALLITDNQASGMFGPVRVKPHDLPPPPEKKPVPLPEPPRQEPDEQQLAKQARAARRQAQREQDEKERRRVIEARAARERMGFKPRRR